MMDCEHQLPKSSLSGFRDTTGLKGGRGHGARLPLDPAQERTEGCSPEQRTRVAANAVACFEVIAAPAMLGAEVVAKVGQALIISPTKTHRCSSPAARDSGAETSAPGSVARL